MNDTLAFSLIACVSANMAIGKNGKLIFRIHDDLKWFVEKTSKKAVLMGRKTFEDCGVLKNRVNLVLSSNKQVARTTKKSHIVHIASKLEDLFEEAVRLGHKEIFVIGGRSLYEMFINDQRTKSLFLCHVPIVVQADTFFPPVDFSIWKPDIEKIFVWNDVPCSCVVYSRAQSDERKI